MFAKCFYAHLMRGKLGKTHETSKNVCVCVVEGPIKNFRAQMATEIHSGATGTLIQSSVTSGFKATCTIYSLFLTFV